jgi:hypothetical protein
MISHIFSYDRTEQRWTYAHQPADCFDEIMAEGQGMISDDVMAQKAPDSANLL